jgi:outer membrane protein TolC
MLLASFASASALEEEEAVRLALAGDPEVAAAAAEVTRVAAETEAGRAWEPPRLRIAGVRSDRVFSDDADPPWARASIGLLWTPPRPGLRAPARAADDARLEAARREEAAVRDDVSREVRVAHRAARALDALLTLQDEEIAVRRGRHAWSELQVARGLATRADALRRRVDVLEAEETREGLVARRDSHARRVASRVGLSLQAPLTLAGAPGPCPVGPDAHEGVGDAVVAARARAAEAVARLHKVRAEGRPGIDDVLVSWVTGDADDAAHGTLRADLVVPTGTAARVRAAQAEADAEALRADAVARDALRTALDARDALARWARTAVRAGEAADVLAAQQAELARAVVAGVIDEDAVAEVSLARIRHARRRVEALAACGEAAALVAPASR